MVAIPPNKEIERNLREKIADLFFYRSVKGRVLESDLHAKGVADKAVSP